MKRVLPMICPPAPSMSFDNRFELARRLSGIALEIDESKAMYGHDQAHVLACAIQLHGTAKQLAGDRAEELYDSSNDEVPSHAWLKSKAFMTFCACLSIFIPAHLLNMWLGGSSIGGLLMFWAGLVYCLIQPWIGEVAE